MAANQPSRLGSQIEKRAEGTAAAATAPAQQGNGQPRSIYQLIEAQKNEIARALPKHMDADRLARVAITTLRQTPRLLECTPQSLLGALMLSAQLGLEPGPLGHAYLVPFYNSREKAHEVTWILGYKGIIDLAQRSGKLLSIEAREVCENDEFEFSYGLEPKLVHKPNIKEDRGAAFAYYGVAQFKDGGRYFLVMSKSDVEKHRSRSRAKDNGPWVTDYDAMARKTVIRAMAPFLPLTVELAGAMAHDEAVHRDVAEAMVEMPAPPTVVDGEVETAAIEGGADGADGASGDATTPAGEPVDTATGEITEDGQGTLGGQAQAGS